MNSQRAARREVALVAVLALGNYPFDLPFYARLAEPVRVVDDWTDADVSRRDNWRKKLADAASAYPVLHRARNVASSRGTTLWRVESTSAGCEGRPSADLPGM